MNTLADAANLMRKRAERATSTPWEQTGWSDYGEPARRVVAGGHRAYIVAEGVGRDDAEHIASWHPDVARAVADLINWNDAHDVGGPSWRLADAAAGAYLGRGASS